MRIISFVILVFWGLNGFTQEIDTINAGIDSLLMKEHIEFLYQRMLDDVEAWAETSEDEETLSEDFEELLAEYEFCREQPININSENTSRLSEMGLLSVFQLEALKQYRKRYGDILYIEELLMVEGFDERTVAVITPIIYCGYSEKVQEQESLTLKKAVTRGKHQLTINYAQKIDHAETYANAGDSLMLAKPNSYYLGGPAKLQLKYNYQYGTKIRLGFVMEKDAGEPLFFTHLSDTIKKIAEASRSPGFDFYGFHLYATDLSISGNTRSGNEREIEHHRYLIIKDLAIGDYQLSFGQGLTLWSGMSFGKASGGSSVMKRGAGVRPKASAGEGKFFRGAAATLAFHDFQATAFYSSRRIDATTVDDNNPNDTLSEITDENPDGQALVSALQESGYHRSIGELAKRHTIRQQVFGGRLAYLGQQLEIGSTFYHLRLSIPLQLKPSKYNQFFFQGDRLNVTGIDLRWQLRKVVFFGELSMSDNKSLAGLAGMTAKPTGYIDFTLMYRNYGIRYQNLFFGAVKESSRGQAEEGFLLSLQCAPAAKWNLFAHCDFFRFKWLTSQVYTPSWGQEYSIQIFHQLNHNASMQVRFKSKTKMKNSNDDHAFSYYPVFYTKRSVQFQLSYTFFNDWVFNSRISYSHYFNDDGIHSRGHLLCQDVAYKPEGKPYSLTLRYALFDSDDYNSRISVYENDVLGAFSIPNLFGLGSRVYVLGKLKLFNALTLYARAGGTITTEDVKIDIKAEGVWKF